MNYLKMGLFSLTGIATLICFVLVVSSNQALWSQEDGVDEATGSKNLQILKGKFESKEELFAYMQGLTVALGVNCKFCHDIQAGFHVDNPELHKEEARKFMKLVNDLNTGFFKDSEQKVTCFTCHQGREHPVNSKEELDKLLAEEESEG